ncbi:MAG: pyridoxal-phosphate-dependent aminotransferase family protein [Candidatus Hodarchaeales archaeon]
MHKKLFIPGPTEVEQDVLLQQTKPLIGHRPKEFTELYTGIIDKLAKFFEITRQHIIVHTCSGTMFMDMTGRNLVKKKALSATCGSFSERMAKAIKACGKEVDTLAVDWGKANTEDAIMEKLAGGDYDTLSLVHNETSTGVRNPIYKIGEKVKKEYPDIMYSIDSVSGMAGDLVQPEKIKSDLIFASSQKAFTLPPGLAIAFASEEAYERAKTIENRGLYTDLVGIIDYYKKKQQTPSTPNISLLYALDYRLDKMLVEGHQNRYKRHVEMAEYTRNWVKEKGFEMLPEPGFESVTVSTIKNTLEKDVKELNSQLAPRGFMIANGYGALAGKTFRIGHMGEWTLSGLKEVLWHIEEIWGL